MYKNVSNVREVSMHTLKIVLTALVLQYGLTEAMAESNVWTDSHTFACHDTEYRGNLEQLILHHPQGPISPYQEGCAEIDSTNVEPINFTPRFIGRKGCQEFKALDVYQPKPNRNGFIVESEVGIYHFPPTTPMVFLWWTNSCRDS